MAHSLLFDSPNSEIYEANNSKKFVAGYFFIQCSYTIDHKSQESY